MSRLGFKGMLKYLLVWPEPRWMWFKPSPTCWMVVSQRSGALLESEGKRRRGGINWRTMRLSDFSQWRGEYQIWCEGWQLKTTCFHSCLSLCVGQTRGRKVQSGRSHRSLNSHRQPTFFFFSIYSFMGGWEGSRAVRAQRGSWQESYLQLEVLCSFTVELLNKLRFLSGWLHFRAAGEKEEEVTAVWTRLTVQLSLLNMTFTFHRTVFFIICRLKSKLDRHEILLSLVFLKLLENLWFFDKKFLQTSDFWWQFTALTTSSGRSTDSVWAAASLSPLSINL